jgi:hypothetical protein
LLPGLIDRNNTASDVWADTAYRSQANEAFLAGRALRSERRAGSRVRHYQCERRLRYDITPLFVSVTPSLQLTITIGASLGRRLSP